MRLHATSPFSVRPRLAAFACALTLSGLGCSGQKPTEAQCQTFTDHYVTLLQKGGVNGRKIKKMRDEQRNRVLELCTIEGTRAEVECALEHETLDAIAQNCK